MERQNHRIAELHSCGRWGLTRTEKRKRDATDRLACIIVHLHHRNTARCLPYLKLVRDEKSEAHNHKITTCSCSHNQMFQVNPNPNLPLSLTERKHLEVDLPQLTQRSFKYHLHQLLHWPQFNPSPLTAAHSILTPNFNPLTSLLAPPLGQIKSQKLNKSHSQIQTQNSNHHRHPSVHTPNPRSPPLCTLKKISLQSPFPLPNTITSKDPPLINTAIIPASLAQQLLHRRP